MAAPSPWTVVSAADYEAHMGPEGADQLGPLSQVFQEVYAATQPDRILLPGCGTGNGLEHVNPKVTARVVGVDVNLAYLGVARQRYLHLGPKLELYCGEAQRFRAAPGSFDLVHVALLLEYVHPEVIVRRVAEWLAERGTCSVVIQLPGGERTDPVSRAMRMVQEAMRLVAPEDLEALFEQYHLARKRAWTVPLRGGKAFWAGVFGPQEK